MELEQEELVRLIFGDHPPENWKDSPEMSLYLAELGNMGPDRVATEPDRVTEELTQIQTQTQDLAFSNYKTFIQTSRCSREIFQEFQTTESHLQQLLEKLPSFSGHCQQFQASAGEISRHRRLTGLTLSKHTGLLEILELPQLMDTVVRNHHYEEALQLHNYVKKLNKKLPTVPIIEDIARNVDNSVKLMLQQLLGQLRSPVQLPQCLKVIGYLRRMDVFDETELRLKFLQARDAWLRSVLSAVSKDDPYIHLTKTMEVLRVHLFDIVTQYRAIFSEEQLLVMPTMANINRLDDPNDTFDNRLLFTAWINNRIQQFLVVLQEDLSKGVNNIESVVGQAMYFGLSFSRVGYDFRQLLAPIFTAAVERQFDRVISSGGNTDQLLAASLARLQLVRLATLPAPQTAAVSADPTQPPLQLVDYPPLAEICNLVINGLNEIRLCAPLTVTGHVTSTIQTLLENFSSQLSNYQATASPGWEEREAAGFSQLVQAMASLLLPYLQKCLSSVFPPTELSSVMGLSLVDLRQQGVGHIRVDKVLEPVRQFIPVAIDTAVMATGGDTTVYVADRMKELASAADDNGSGDNGNDGDNDHGNDEPSGKKAQEEETENSKWVVGGDDEGEKADVERPEIHGDSENETTGVETSHDNVIDDIIGNALTLASASEQNNIVEGLDNAK